MGTGLLVAVVVAGIYYAGETVVKVDKVIAHGVCHAVTLGHKCKSTPVTPVVKP